MRILVPRSGEPRSVVVLLRDVRSESGQEFLSGWTVGFSPQSADELVAAGHARRSGSTEPTKPIAPLPTPEGFEPTKWAPVSLGLPPDAPAPTEDKQSAKIQKRRK